MNELIEKENVKIENMIFLRCQNGTLKENGRGQHRKYMPYVFSKYGITMLSGLLKSNIEITASLKIVDTFIAMRKYISSNLLEQKYINNMVLKYDDDIKLLQESFSKFEEKKQVNEIYFNGQIFDAYSKIYEIFSNAKKELIVIDNYADNTILDIIKRLDVDKYNKQYSNLKVIYNKTFHDRYFILDNKELYLCGASVNRIEYKTFSITKVSDKYVVDSLMKKIKN